MGSIPDASTRKPVDQLTSTDFNTIPIWEFASDEEGVEGRDETWVRPTRDKKVRMRRYSQLAATTFTTPGGKCLDGFMIVSTDEAVEISPGALLMPNRYVCLPDLSPGSKQLFKAKWWKEMVAQLQCPASEVFPLQWSLRVLIGKEAALRNGTLAGMMP